MTSINRAFQLSKAAQAIERVRMHAQQAFADLEFRLANNLPIEVTEEDKQQAESIIKHKPGAPVAPTSYGAAKRLKDLLDQYDFEIMNKAKQMKTYVITKLFEYAEGPDKAQSMRALETLGKVTEINIFAATKIDINVSNRTTLELEEELHNLLKGYNMDVLEGQLVKVEGQLSLEREMLEDADLIGDIDE